MSFEIDSNEMLPCPYDSASVHAGAYPEYKSAVSFLNVFYLQKH